MTVGVTTHTCEIGSMYIAAKVRPEGDRGERRDMRAHARTRAQRHARTSDLCLGAARQKRGDPLDAANCRVGANDKGGGHAARDDRCRVVGVEEHFAAKRAGAYDIDAVVGGARQRWRAVARRRSVRDVWRRRYLARRRVVCGRRDERAHAEAIEWQCERPAHTGPTDDADSRAHTST
jgi:hypothetical protein